MLTEANPFEGIEEKLGNSIYEFTLTTGSEISKSQGQKNSMVAIRAIVEAMGADQSANYINCQRKYS